ncbi:hypothetical protein CYMTET_16221 [Cymbomonas tetramitiformis]|uniref:Uncharacterized protein n=1 Tax=Cymbomonas tetramitiformis TaxID=36881 RepID=A0AAE0L880_9CHLO|nr:hypothetical protein CYMTET_16221 [Cymbomonas tetramitiformis]
MTSRRMTRHATGAGARRRLLASAVQPAVDLPDGVRDTPTVATPPLQPPGQAVADDTPEIIAAREAYVEQTRIVKELFANGSHRSIAKSVREEVLGDKDTRFKGDDDDAYLLGDLLEALGAEFETAGLALGVFDISDPTLLVHSKVNAFLYDVLGRIIASHSAAYRYLRGTHGDRDGRRAIVDLAKGCVEVGVRESRQDEHSALRYPAGVDPRPILAKEARLVRENKARDWRPDEETRKAALLQRLDFEFYKSIRDKYVLPRNLAQVSLAELSHEVGALWVAWARHSGSSPQAATGETHSSALASGAAGGAAGAGDAEAIKRIFQKLDFVEAYIKMEIEKKNGATSPTAVVADAKRKRGGLKGYRAGMTAQPAVGFDTVAKREKPLCPRCPGGAYHGWLQCPLGGLKPENAGTAAAYCAPTELTPEEQHSISLCYVFQQAAEEGAAAFAGAAERYGAPAVLHGERGPAGGIDLSAYGFAVDWPGASDDSDDSDDEALGEIGELKRQVEDMAARRGVSFTHASLAPQPETVPPAAALPQPAAAAPATGAMRWQDRARAHSQLTVSLPQAGAPDQVVPEPQGPFVRGPDGLDYGLGFAGDHSHVAPGEQTPVGMHRLGTEPADADESEGYDSDETDKEFDEKLAVDRAAYFAGDVVAAAPAVGGRACGVGQSAFASYVPKWLLVSTMLLCVTAVGALQASSGFQPGGAYPPAGFHTESSGHGSGSWLVVHPTTRTHPLIMRLRLSWMTSRTTSRWPLTQTFSQRIGGAFLRLCGCGIHRRRCLVLVARLRGMLRGRWCHRRVVGSTS